MLITPISAVPGALEIREALGGGFLEAIPYFNSIRLSGKIEPCVAFCDEEGKLKGLPVNELATVLWFADCARNRRPRPKDVLVGPIVIVSGDRELLAAL